MTLNHFTRTKWGFTQKLGENAELSVEYYNDVEGVGRAKIYTGSNTMTLIATHASDRKIMEDMGIPMDENRIISSIDLAPVGK